MKPMPVNDELVARAISRRRDFHKYAEAGWTEFRTASIVAEIMSQLGYEVLVGDEVMEESVMMGLPSPTDLDKHFARALEQGAKQEWAEKMRGGKTGVVASMTFSKPGPLVAFRFDIDANDQFESESSAHFPFREGFSSVNPGAMHACGHDAHTAVGLALAELLAKHQDSLAGKVKFIFQPAEEGVRGAKAMAAKGIVDDADYFLVIHFGNQLNKTGQFCSNVGEFLATAKLDAAFSGVAAHPSKAPEQGRNALLAAASATVHLHGVSRHGKGVTAINVGFLQGGIGRNAVPDKAILKLETRGSSTEINEFLRKEAIRIIQGSALTHDVKVEIREMGSAAGGNNSPELARRLEDIAKEADIFEEHVPYVGLLASEDCTYFMERVQSLGGLAAFIAIGTNLTTGHHESLFDMDEAAIGHAIRYLACVSSSLLEG